MAGDAQPAALRIHQIQRVAQTRAALLHAVGAAVAVQPWSTLSAGQLAHRAAVTRGTLHAHFRDRDALLCAWLAARLDAALLVRQPAPDAGRGARLRQLFLATTDYLLLVLTPIQRSEPAYVALVQHVAQQSLAALAAPLLRPRRSPMPMRPRGARVTAALAGALLHSAQAWCDGARDVSAEQEAAAVAAALKALARALG